MIDLCCKLALFGKFIMLKNATTVSKCGFWASAEIPNNCQTVNLNYKA